jgi:hypothetical protein
LAEWSPTTRKALSRKELGAQTIRPKFKKLAVWVRPTPANLCHPPNFGRMVALNRAPLNGKRSCQGTGSGELAAREQDNGPKVF